MNNDFTVTHMCTSTFKELITGMHTEIFFRRRGGILTTPFEHESQKKASSTMQLNDITFIMYKVVIKMLQYILSWLQPCCMLPSALHVHVVGH